MKLSERAKLRLRLARGLLQGRPEAFGLPKGWKLNAPSDPYTHILATLDSIAPEASKSLQEAVDWLEEYEGSQEPEKAPGGATRGEQPLPSRQAAVSPFATVATKSRSRERGG